MWDFLASAFNKVVGLITGNWQSAVTAVVNWVNQIEYAHYGYWHTVAGNVLNAWQEHTRDTLTALQGMQEFMFAQAAFDNYIKRNQIPWLANWITWLGGKQANDLNNAIAMLERDIRDGDTAQQNYSESIFSWVVKNVLDYLTGQVGVALGWIESTGSTIWHYITHPDDLAGLLFWPLIVALESAAWDVAEKLGEFFLALIVKNLGRFLTLVETIINAVI